MNKTQKSAWLILFGVLIDAVASIYVGLIIALRRLPPKPLGWAVTLFMGLAGVVLLAAVVFALARRQSPVEPASDERDSMIQKKSILLSFVGGWVLLALVLLILALTLGETGAVPVYLLTVMNYGVFLVTGLIYAVATLLQYGREARDER